MAISSQRITVSTTAVALNTASTSGQKLEIKNTRGHAAGPGAGGLPEGTRGRGGMVRAARTRPGAGPGPMTIASLVVKLTADAGPFHRELDAAARRMETVGRRIARAGREISLAISGPLIAAG